VGRLLGGRWGKVNVDWFAVGFGPELLGCDDKHGTRWELCAIRVCGDVEFRGDAEAASTRDFDKAREMSAEEREGSFVHKRVGQRAAVVAAGPIANFILAIVIFSLSFMLLGRYVSDPSVSSVVEGSAAEEAGFQKGDLVVAIDGSSIETFSDIPRIVAPNPERELLVEVLRDGMRIELPVVPRRQETVDRFGNKNAVGIIGISSNAEEASGRTVMSGPVEAVGQAVGETWFIISSTLFYLKDIVIGQQSADQLGGPIRIAKVSGEVATLGWGALINLAAVLSVSIGLLNLFPIPMLDGGHLVFYAIEAVRGKPLGEKAQEVGFRIGLTLVLMLMVFATWNDITNIFLS